MRNLAFGYGYASGAATASATYTATGYSASNVVDLARGNTWKSSGTTTAQRLMLDFGSAVAPSFLGLANCNWSGWGTTKLRSSPDGSTWTDILTLSSLPSTDSTEDWASLLSGVTARQYWCLEFTTPTAAPEVGVFYLGTGVTLSKNPVYGGTEDDFFSVAVEESEGGVVQAEELTRRRARFEMAWDPSSASIRDEVRPVIRSEGGPRRPFWLLPADESGTATLGRAYLVRYKPTVFSVKRRFRTTYAFAISVLEEA